MLATVKSESKDGSPSTNEAVLHPCVFSPNAHRMEIQERRTEIMLAGDSFCTRLWRQTYAYTFHRKFSGFMVENKNQNKSVIGIRFN